MATFSIKEQMQELKQWKQYSHFLNTFNTTNDTEEKHPFDTYIGPTMCQTQN